MLNFVQALFSRSPRLGVVSDLLNQPGQCWSGEATVSQEIRPNAKGRVRFQGTWWPARCDHEVVLQPGDRVRVIGIHEITLLVHPIGMETTAPLDLENTLPLDTPLEDLA